MAQDIFYFFPECEYILEFESYEINSLNNSVPYFLTFDPTNEDGDWYAINVEDPTLMGQRFEIVLKVNIFDPDPEELVYEHFDSNVTDSRYIHWTIDLTYFPYIPPNDPPYFDSMLKSNIILNLNEEASFSTGIPSNDTVWIDVTWKPDYL